MREVRAHDDLEAILSQVNTDVDAITHGVGSAFDATFTWDYAKGARPALDKLYEKAKVSQWNGSTDLDWSIDVDPERTAVELVQARGDAIHDIARHHAVGRQLPTGDRDQALRAFEHPMLARHL